MWLEEHIEFKINCENLADFLRELSPGGPEDFDETLALWLWDVEESGAKVKSRLDYLRRSFNAESLRDSCEKLTRMKNRPSESEPPDARGASISYVITPEAANISQNVDRLADEFDIVLERAQAGVEIAKRYFSFDEDGELATLMPPPEAELREIREAFDYAFEHLARMIGEFEDLGFFNHVWHLRRQTLCDDCRSEGASIEDDFSNELFLPPQ
jgi:hypothetical protein